MFIAECLSGFTLRSSACSTQTRGECLNIVVLLLSKVTKATTVSLGFGLTFFFKIFYLINSKSLDGLSG